jgi:hypothetical protein
MKLATFISAGAILASAGFGSAAKHVETVRSFSSERPYIENQHSLFSALCRLLFAASPVFELAFARSLLDNS